ncbi:MAG TPA: hypothetical protein PLM62_20390, partial [Zoogloea sp.]|nr:hypothetical protein [Zoogloea sp.]
QPAVRVAVPQREDLYQMAAYLGRWGAAGILLYPEDPAAPRTPPAEAGSPWVLADGTAVSFAALPAGVDAAAAKLRGIVRLTSRSSLNGRLAACG